MKILNNFKDLINKTIESIEIVELAGDFDKLVINTDTGEKLVIGTYTEWDSCGDIDNISYHNHSEDFDGLTPQDRYALGVITHQKLKKELELDRIEKEKKWHDAQINNTQTELNSALSVVRRLSEKLQQLNMGSVKSN
jgi:hypothetical protein